MVGQPLTPQARSEGRFSLSTLNAATLSRLSLIGALTIALLASLQITSTYRVFNQTWDEPAHLAAGMEWLDHGTYTYEELHPPIARVAVALGPYINGLRLSGQNPKPEQMWAEGNAILWERGEYFENLTLARLGVLPFFIILVVTLWYWARTLYGDAVAIVAALLLATLPPVLGHAGLATTDVPFTATFTLALFTFSRWLGKPSRRRAVEFGAAAALVTATKFSALIFLPACILALILLRVWVDRSIIQEWRQDAGPRLKALALAIITATLVIWGVYRLSVKPMTGPEQRPHQTIVRFFGQGGTWHDWAERFAEGVPVPAPEFFHGINRVRDIAATGRKAYLLGEVRSNGWWYFFPIALAVKTPIAFLILATVGLFAMFQTWNHSRDWGVFLPAATAATLLLICLPIKFNIGLRHILPIYPFLAMLAGLAALHLWNMRRFQVLCRSVVLCLLAWQVVSTLRAHPDYLASFNEFAAGRPERILVDSDLDCGQDLLRLREKLNELHVREFSISYNGSADLSRHELPSFRRLVPFEPTKGWVAISLYMLKTGGRDAPPNAFAWLEAHQPVAQVGKSIRLYYIAD